MERLTEEAFLERIRDTNAFELKRAPFDVVWNALTMEVKLIVLEDGALETVKYLGPDPAELGYVGHVRFLQKVDYEYGSQFAEILIRDRMSS